MFSSLSKFQVGLWHIDSNELEELQIDLAELLHILHAVARPPVREVIQADIDVTLVKMESLKDFRNQFETKISWARVTTLKHNKSKNKKRGTSSMETKTRDPEEMIYHLSTYMVLKYMIVKL